MTELPMTLKERYVHYCNTPSDINEHLPKLREYAEKCGHITEFGTRHGVSTTAFLFGLLGGMNMNATPMLFSYDIIRQKEVDWLEHVGGRLFRFQLLNTIAASTMPIRQTDMLFIDSLHTYAQASVELANHASKVKKWIAFHDTVTYGLQDEGRQPPHPYPRGLKQAVMDFKANESRAGIYWDEVYHSDANNGLTIIQRVER